MKTLFALIALTFSIGAQAKAAKATGLLEFKNFGVIRCSDARQNLSLEIVKMSVNEWALTQRIDGTQQTMTYHQDDVKIKILKAVTLYSSEVANAVTDEESIADIAITAEIEIKGVSKSKESLICEKVDYKFIHGDSYDQ